MKENVIAILGTRRVKQTHDLSTQRYVFLLLILANAKATEQLDF